jgi:hypothetical protein
VPSSVETRSLRALARRYHRAFTFYLGNPFPRLFSVFNPFVADAECSQAFYDVEYDRLTYDNSFHGSPEERRLNRLLYYFEKIAALYELGTISLKDLELVRYEFLRVYRNPAVQEYFKTLDQTRDRLDAEGGTYARYRRIAELLQRKKSTAV